MTKRILLINLLACIFTINLFSQQATPVNQNNLPQPYAPLTTKLFADSLFEQGFLQEAEGEYKRFLFTNQNDNENNLNSTLFSLCKIYKFQNNKDGIFWLRNEYYDDSSNFVKEKINLLSADFLFRERNSLDFSNLFHEINPELNLFSKDFQNLFTASDLLLNNKISQLSVFCSSIQNDNPKFSQLSMLSENYKLKSPGIALMLSSLIPGAGKWYTGSYSAFLTSFLSIGSFVAGTVYTGIESKWKSWQPYAFGICGLVLYITDLYGSYQSAKRYNAALYRQLCEETEKLYEEVF